MDFNREDFDLYMAEQKRWTDLLEGLKAPSTSTASSGNMSFTISAGGIGILVLLVVSSFVLGIAMSISFSTASRMNNLERRQDRQDDYIQAIYSIAPQLKPKEKTP